jgi:phage tail sheath protein FI
MVFEPNNEKLWGRVRVTISEFLMRAWKNGALAGRKPEEAFFVKCDRTTMTQDDLDSGRLICIIGVAPVRAAEFMIFRISQWAGGSAVTE